MNGAQKLDRDLAKLLEDAPEARKELHREIAVTLEKELGLAIGVSGLNDGRGTVRRWQIKHVGTGGGYAAIRAAGKRDAVQTSSKGKSMPQTGPNSPGAITNYLQSGHVVRPPSGKAKRLRRGQAKQLAVRGYGFYDTAAAAAEAKALQAANAFADRLAAELGGG